MTPPALATLAPREIDTHPALSIVTRRPELSRHDIDGLSSALLDLGCNYEAALRTVLSMQRMLERVRRYHDLSPEAALLIEEMVRQCQDLVARGGSLAGGLETTGERLAALSR